MRRRTVMTISTKGIPRRRRRGSRSQCSPHHSPQRCLSSGDQGCRRSQRIMRPLSNGSQNSNARCVHIAKLSVPVQRAEEQMAHPHRRPHRRVVGPHRCVVRPHRRPHSRRRRRRTRTRTRMLLHRRRGCGRHRGSRQSGACRRPHRRPHRRVVRQHHGTHHTEAKECRQHQRRGAATKGGHGGAATVARICELGHLMSLSQRSIRHCTARAT
jgi:hypothetical protein